MSPTYISYQVVPVSLSEHLFDVTMHIKLSEGSNAPLMLTLPAWIPGSYMIRDFARNLIQIHSANPQHILHKTDKQTWQLSHKVSHKGNLAITECEITYRVFAFDLSVRSAYINHEYAFFNGTSVCLKVLGHENITHYLQVLSTPTTHDWQVVTAMPLSEDKPAQLDLNSDIYASKSYHEFIDHPVVFGEICSKSFEVQGVRFHVVFTGKETMDLQRICNDLVPICEHHIALFGECPVKEYWFITLLCEKGFGGLEHKASTILQYSRFGLPMVGESDDTNESYQQFLSLCSHELFHTWHVKRIRPQVMLAPELSHETYTPQLWIYEGFTSLYDDLTLARTSLISPKEYCKILGQSVTRLLRNPGRNLQSIAESSFDAWTRFYKQDANSVNHIVSYYLKGSIVALALDITIRQQSNNEYSLDTVMQLLWQQFGRDESGTLDRVINDICTHELNIDIDSFLHVAVNSTMDLPLPNMVQSIGLKLHLRTRESTLDKGGYASNNALTRDTGLSFTDAPMGIKVSQVLSNSAAAQSGIQLGDIVLACNHFKTNEAHFHRNLTHTNLGETMLLHIMRDEQMLEITFIAQEPQQDTCYFTIENKQMFHQWLGLS